METVAESTASQPQFTKKNHRRGFADLPRELRDEIYIYAFRRADIDNDLTDRPCKIYRSLAQVSRTVRSESADIYWSQRIPVYECEWLSTPPRSPFEYEHDKVEVDKPAFAFCPVYRTLSNREDLRELEAWYNSYGRLALHRIRELSFIVPGVYGDVEFGLQAPFKLPYPFHGKEGGLGAFDEELRAFAVAILVPDGRRKLTLERFVTLCDVLTIVGYELAKFIKAQKRPPCLSSRARMEIQEDKILALLSIDR